MTADRHLHTHFSPDSEEEPENTIKRAIELKMDEICITDHYDMDMPDGEFCFEPDKYWEAMTPLKEKYKDIINIRIGVEVRLGEDISDKIDKFLKAYPWEYKIGSIHLADGKDPYERDLFDMDDVEFYRHYFDDSLKGLKSCGGFDTFGHLDYVLRYGYAKDRDYNYDNYAETIEEILKELIRRDITLEVNTAGLRKGLKYPHPYPETLRRYRELGGKKLAFGSDAHRAQDVGADFDKALEYIKKFGFNEADII